MGYVYRAHDPRIDRQVALKVLRSNHLSSKKYVQRFTKEAMAIGRLSHPNIVTVHDVGQDHGTIYIAMEFIEGQPLDLLLKTRKFDIAEVIDIGIQVAMALDYAHQKGVVHRDIKPSNLILLESGQIKLTDFGIAHLEDTSATHQTRTGDILGTPAFMSPEQIEGETIDRRSDLFSLGIILYRLTSGEWPFSGQSMAALFNAISNSQPQKPKKINPDISPKLSALIMKSLDKDPDRRFQTGKEMATALRTFQGRATNSFPRWGKRSLAYGVALVVAAAGLIGGLVFKPYNENRSTLSADHVALPAASKGNGSSISPNPAAGENGAIVDTHVIRAEVRISSNPANAEIFIDNQLKGNTPINLQLPLGIYELRLNLPEHYEIEASIQVRDPGPMPLKFKLIPMRTT